MRLESLNFQINSLRKKIEEDENNDAAIKQHDDDNIKNLGAAVYERLVGYTSGSLIDRKKKSKSRRKLLNYFESQK